MLILLSLFTGLSFAETSTPLPNAELTIEKTITELRIGIQPKEHTHLNLDAPLKLELTGIQAKKSGPYSKSDFDAKKSAFTIPLPGQPTARLDGSFKITYSICSDDNKSCRRIVETRALTN